MVNRGPSNGCRECRARKLKCGGEKPGCLRCSNSKINCTGYDTFRERRELVWKNHAYARQGKSLGARRSQAVGVRKEDVWQECSELSLPSALSPDLDLQVTCYFFVNVHPLMLGYYIDDLPNIYNRERPTSILSLATIAVSASFTSLHPQYSRFKPYALFKYAECLRLLREAANDPETVECDPFLMAINVLGTYEHSRSLALEPCATRRHRDGAVAVIKSRSKHSFQSRLSQELLRFTRAEVVYDCVVTGNVELMDDFLQVANERTSPEFVHADPQGHSDFFTLCNMLEGFPKIRAREQALFDGIYDGSSLAAEGSSLLTDAKREYQKASQWPSQQSRRRPCQSHTLRQSHNPTLEPLYPHRVDIFCDTTQATMCNSWRMGQVIMLTIISRVAALLSSLTCCPDTASFLAKEQEYAEHLIVEHIDGFCSSVPYLIYPANSEARTASYPHGPDSAQIPSDLGPEIIAGMSQLKKCLEAGSQAYCVPHSQRQWMQQYLTLLSTNRTADQEKALRLELTSNAAESQSSDKRQLQLRGKGYKDLPPPIRDNNPNVILTE